MAMEAMRVRIVAPIPGKGVVGIEVPNKDRETVFLKEIAEQDAFQKSSRATMCLGKDIEGMPYVFDLAKAPHLLIAGTTGSGKSVAVNSMIMSILSRTRRKRSASSWWTRRCSSCRCTRGSPTCCCRW